MLKAHAIFPTKDIVWQRELTDIIHFVDALDGVLKAWNGHGGGWGRWDFWFWCDKAIQRGWWDGFGGFVII